MKQAVDLTRLNGWLNASVEAGHGIQKQSREREKLPLKIEATLVLSPPPIPLSFSLTLYSLLSLSFLSLSLSLFLSALLNPGGLKTQSLPGLPSKSPPYCGCLEIGTAVSTPVCI